MGGELEKRRGHVVWKARIWLSREQPEALCESLRKSEKGYSKEGRRNRTESRED
jgi:hypothetical protein